MLLCTAAVSLLTSQQYMSQPHTDRGALHLSTAPQLRGGKIAHPFSTPFQAAACIVASSTIAAFRVAESTW